jgi:hypothetical protein
LLRQKISFPQNEVQGNWQIATLAILVAAAAASPIHAKGAAMATISERSTILSAEYSAEYSAK